MGDTRTEAELTAARRIAHTYPADLVLSTLLKYLDTPKSQIARRVGSLGRAPARRRSHGRAARWPIAERSADPHHRGADPGTVPGTDASRR
ncbi:MAG: hypothetical protein R2838_04905 [Caldilineaceae bacterium]